MRSKRRAPQYSVSSVALFCTCCHYSLLLQGGPPSPGTREPGAGEAEVVAALACGWPGEGGWDRPMKGWAPASRPAVGWSPGRRAVRSPLAAMVAQDPAGPALPVFRRRTKMGRVLGRDAAAGISSTCSTCLRLHWSFRPFLSTSSPSCQTPWHAAPDRTTWRPSTACPLLPP